MAKEKAGYGKCPIDGERVVWRRGEKSSSLAFTCQECGYQGYAPAGSDAEKELSKGFFMGVKAVAAVADPVSDDLPVDPVPVPVPVPPKAKKRGIFEGVY